ncbi:MAG: hypothetical protein ACLUIQ_12365 [Dialister invisus]
MCGEKYASFHGGRYGMLHGADKGFIESGKYGKRGNISWLFESLPLELIHLYACDDLLYNHGEAAINALRV